MSIPQDTSLEAAQHRRRFLALVAEFANILVKTRGDQEPMELESRQIPVREDVDELEMIELLLQKLVGLEY